MKFLKSLVLAVAVLSSTQALATSVTTSGDVSLNTDYIFRGISQTNGDSAAQANLKVDINKFYISAFTSNVNFDTVDLDNTASYELDLAVGFANSVGAVGYDVGAIAYMYPNSTSDIEIDTWEVYGGVGYTIGSSTDVGIKVSYADDYFGTGTSWYTAVPVEYTSRYFDVLGQIGYLNLNDSEVVASTTDYLVKGTGHVTSSVDVYVQYTSLSIAQEDFKLDFDDFKDGTYTGGIAYNF